MTEPVILQPDDILLLDQLRRDNTHDGARRVIENDRGFAQAFRLSENGYVGIEQHAKGVILHISRKGLKALAQHGC